MSDVCQEKVKNEFVAKKSVNLSEAFSKLFGSDIGQGFRRDHEQQTSVISHFVVLLRCHYSSQLTQRLVTKGILWSSI